MKRRNFIERDNKSVFQVAEIRFVNPHIVLKCIRIASHCVCVIKLENEDEQQPQFKNKTF